MAKQFYNPEHVKVTRHVLEREVLQLYAQYLLFDLDHQCHDPPSGPVVRNLVMLRLVVPWRRGHLAERLRLHMVH